MKENDLKKILNSSKGDLLKSVKRWKKVTTDTTIFSGIMLQELGEWESIAESINEFCTYLDSDWDLEKSNFFERHEVEDFKELKNRIEIISKTTIKYPIQEAGRSLKEVAGTLNSLFWTLIIVTIIVVLGALFGYLGERVLILLQIGCGLRIIIASIGIIQSLKSAGKLLESYNEDR